MGNNVPNSVTRMEEAIEQHQPLGHTERELKLRSQTPKTTLLQSDPNSQNPNENQPKTDDEDEMAMKIICDEPQNNLVLSQVLELDHQENGKMKERLESEVENNVEDEMAMQIICDELQNNLVLSQVLELDHQEDGKMKERLESEVENNVEGNDNDGWGYDGWGYDDDENRSESQNNGEKENGFEEGDSSKEVGFNKANRIKRKFKSPLRPDAQGCPYKLKTGMCKFGSNCKFNHHPKRKFQGEEMVVMKEEGEKSGKWVRVARWYAMWCSPHRVVSAISDLMSTLDNFNGGGVYLNSKYNQRMHLDSKYNGRRYLDQSIMRSIFSSFLKVQRYI